MGGDGGGDGGDGGGDGVFFLMQKFVFEMLQKCVLEMQCFGVKCNAMLPHIFRVKQLCEM